jgi:hypothetical protein
MSTSYDRAPEPPERLPAGPEPAPVPGSGGAYAPGDPTRRVGGRHRLDGWLGRPAPRAPDEEPRRRPRWPVLAWAGAVVAVAGAGAVVARGGEEPRAEQPFGTVVSPARTLVRESDGADTRPLDQGETVMAGWMLEAAGDVGTLRLEGGGLVRFGGGARVTFTAGAVRSGTRRSPRPAISIEAGRLWFNPGGDTRSTALVLKAGSFTVTSTGNPVAVDCSDACAVEAPAGGATVRSRGLAVTPAVGEVVIDADTVVVRAAGGPSEWSAANLDDDAGDLPQPQVRTAAGVAGEAVPATFYALDLDITGPGEGGDLGAAITWRPGERHTLDAAVDTPACQALPCSTRISSFDRVDGGGTGPDRAGVVRVGDGHLAITLDRPIGCLDAAGAVTTQVGTTSITADLVVTESTHDRATDRWTATGVTGTGTIAVVVTDPTCPTVAYLPGARTIPFQATGTAT